MKKHTSFPYKAICFLDRDGTINVNVGYPHKAEELQLLPNAALGIATMNRHQILVVVVTNQSGIARGYFQLDDMHSFHQEISTQLAHEHAEITEWRYCPHHPNDRCSCRKPSTGMIDDIITSFDVPMFFVGDSQSDMECAQKIGATPFAIQHTKAALVEGVHIVADLKEVADRIIEDLPA